MRRITLLLLTFMTTAAFATDELERNCDPDYGLVDGSCLEQPEHERGLLDIYEWVASSSWLGNGLPSWGLIRRIASMEEGCSDSP